MTTIKEYEAMMEGATDAIITYEAQNKLELDFCYDGGSKDAVMCVKEFYKFIDIPLDLIRVIELAEDGLKNAQATLRHYKLYDLEKVEKALSEIRKLKGE